MSQTGLFYVFYMQDIGDEEAEKAAQLPVLLRHHSCSQSLLHCEVGQVPPEESPYLRECLTVGQKGSQLQSLRL